MWLLLLGQQPVLLLLLLFGCIVYQGCEMAQLCAVE
jgi:hypothetical protein